MFQLLRGCVDSLEAGEELRITHGVARGYGLSNDGNNQQIQSVMRALIARAYPERYD